MTDSELVLNQAPMGITLIINESDDAEFRDRQARQLVNLAADWPGVAAAQLASAEAPEHARGEASLVGEILLKVAPDLVKQLAKYLFNWLSVADCKSVKLKVGEREAEFPADTSPEQLEKWLQALAGSSTARDDAGADASASADAETDA